MERTWAPPENGPSRTEAAITGDDQALLAAIDRLYAAVEGQDLWPDTIRVLGELIGGRRDFWGIDPSLQNTNAYSLGTGCHPTTFLSRRDLANLDRYAQDFGRLIVHISKIVFLNILRPRSDTSACQAIGLTLIRRYPQIFQAWEENPALSPPSSVWRSLMGALWEDGRIFSRENLRCMQILAPHLKRALRLQMRLTTEGLRAEMISGVLDGLTVGVALIDHSGRTIWVNTRAREIVGPSGSGQLNASAKALRELTAGVPPGEQRFLLTISRGTGARPLLVAGLPLTRTGESHGSCEGTSAQSVSRVIFIVDPDRIDKPSIASLRQAFDLTYREAHVAIAVAQGNGLQAAADATGVALTTARTQLQQVFAKTGTRHQAELAALVNRTLMVLRSD